MSLNIKENAIFVADSHFNERRNEFLLFLKQLQDSQIDTKQVFLMGDMFDFISYESKYFVKKNQKLINLLNDLANKYDIYYLEGNHDYNMQNLFPKIKVYKRENQPLFAQYKNQSVAISHGDIFVNDSFYEIYCKIIRSKTLLKFLNFIDYKNFISKKIYYTLLKKDICHKINNFKEIVTKRLKHYNSDIIIEGHFHQGNEYFINNKRYKNIPSLTCNKKYTQIKDNSFIEVKI